MIHGIDKKKYSWLIFFNILGKIRKVMVSMKEQQKSGIN